jgi:uncharacterized coiled-coil protein SlyX
MPQPNQEKNSVKIAFMGQVPVKVIGKVSPGDYILPNELGGGFGKAINPKDMRTRDYKKVAGVVWNTIGKFSENLSIINVAVGLNSNELSDKIIEQEENIKTLQGIVKELQIQMRNSNDALAALIPGFDNLSDVDSSALMSKKMSSYQPKTYKNNAQSIAYTGESDIIYFEIDKEQIETAINMARMKYVEMLDNSHVLNKAIPEKNKISNKEIEEIALLPINEHPFWNKIDTDPSYKEEIVDLIQRITEKSYHTHKEHAHKFTNLKIRKN